MLRGHLTFHLLQRLKFQIVVSANQPDLTHGSGKFCCQSFTKKFRVEGWVKLLYSGNCGRKGRRRQQDAAVLQSHAFSASLRTADNFYAGRMDDIIRVLTEETQKRFLWLPRDGVFQPILECHGASGYIKFASQTARNPALI